MQRLLTRSRRSRRRRFLRRARPRLQFTPYAWAKLLYLRDAGPTEVGGFGISAADQLLRIEDVVLVQQDCTANYVEFDDASIADHFDMQVERGLTPERFGRIWIHTHPGTSAEPSDVDEQSFAAAFGGSDWVVMAILARGGAASARLRFNCGPGGDVPLDVVMDYTPPFPAADPADWQAEYNRCVHVVPAQVGLPEPAEMIGVSSPPRSWTELLRPEDRLSPVPEQEAPHLD